MHDLPPESLTISPPAREWRLGSIGGGSAFSASALAAFRSELGLPQGPAILSGHQAEIWHAGILAKYFAALAAARRFGASAAWIVVDQDTGTPEALHYPGTGWSRRRWQIAPTVREDLPLALRAPIRPGALPTDAISPWTTAALARVSSVLAQGEGEASLAAQFTQALRTLLGPSAESVCFIQASRVATTSLYREFVERMLADPARCVEAYNAAAVRHPEAGIRPLRTTSPIELPLWLVAPELGRPAATTRSAAGATLPRALTMTALMRMAGCDLFIHGLGGGAYDKVTDEWIGAWLGAGLAPTAVVTATRYARPEDAGPAPDPVAAFDALRRAHRARHHPVELGDAEAESLKRALLSEVGVASGPAKRTAYTRMHAVLRDYRERHAPELHDLAARGRALSGAAKKGRGGADRTWPFVFLSDAQFAALRSEIDSAFDAGGGA
ncbi:MAG: hypothetical protein ACOYN0_09115 [Phycisphaerales bacterium]